ncbi:hypothetical protein [Lactococcus nasutitermitis]|nr:hypothetical protein [Lactococcus nasutitermitis]
MNDTTFESTIGRLPYEVLPTEATLKDFLKSNFPLCTAPEPMVVDEPEVASHIDTSSPIIPAPEPELSLPTNTFSPPATEEGTVPELASSAPSSLTAEERAELSELRDYADEADAYIKKADEENEALRNENERLKEKINVQNDNAENISLKEENEQLKQQLSENSVFTKNLKEVETENTKLKYDLKAMEKRTQKAEKLATLDSPEASVVEMVTVMRSLSSKLSNSSKLLENKAGKELKEMQNEVERLKAEKDATEQIKNNLRALLGSD